MITTELYTLAKQRMKADEIEHSDGSATLYLKVTDVSSELIEDYEWKNKVTTFNDWQNHELWYEIPFAWCDEKGNFLSDRSYKRI